jgi:hypothetical protein
MFSSDLAEGDQRAFLIFDGALSAEASKDAQTKTSVYK